MQSELQLSKVKTRSICRNAKRKLSKFSTSFPKDFNPFMHTSMFVSHSLLDPQIGEIEEMRDVDGRPEERFKQNLLKSEENREIPIRA